MKAKENTPIVIVGASMAGCCAAMLYANKGFDVILLDKCRDLSSYKTHCTHFVQPIGVPVLREMGVYDDMPTLGKPSKARFWTSAGWLETDIGNYSNGEYAINLERSRFDPYIKSIIANHESIDLRLNALVYNIISTDKGYTVQYKDEQSNKIDLEASLAIAADGRYSTLSKILDNNSTTYKNDRFVYFAYFEGIAFDDDRFSNFWMLGEKMAFIYPLIEGRSLVALYIPHTEKDNYKQDLEGEFNKVIDELPDGPDMQHAERITPIHGMNNIDTYFREGVAGNVPFIGDAVLSLDPAAGTGCSFALISAKWLVDISLNEQGKLREDLSVAFSEYAEKHRNWMMPHVKGITADSIVNKTQDADNEFYTNLKNDAELLEDFLDLTGRLITPKDFQKRVIKKMIAKKKLKNA